eukprot:6138040-Amphidinium_carterae.1
MVLWMGWSMLSGVSFSTPLLSCAYRLCAFPGPSKRDYHTDALLVLARTTRLWYGKHRAASELPLWLLFAMQRGVNGLFASHSLDSLRPFSLERRSAVINNHHNIQNYILAAQAAEPFKVFAQVMRAFLPVDYCRRASRISSLQLGLASFCLG